MNSKIMKYLRPAFLLVLTLMFLEANAQTNHYSIETSSHIDYNDLQDGFLKTPNESGLRCYWWWLNGYVSRDGIVRDLDNMRKQGISGALVFHTFDASINIELYSERKMG